MFPADEFLSKTLRRAQKCASRVTKLRLSLLDLSQQIPSRFLKRTIATPTRVPVRTTAVGSGVAAKVAFEMLPLMCCDEPFLTFTSDIDRSKLPEPWLLVKAKVFGPFVRKSTLT